MKNFALLACLSAICFFACTENAPENSSSIPENKSLQDIEVSGLNLNLDANPEWQYKNLQLYPVTAAMATLEKNTGLPILKTLAEAMQTTGFRITERKQFGRSPDNWYNALTVQNKTTDTIFLMSGDVVTGGNQDRVIAHDDVVLPGTVKNIEVFCVEAGRSSYYNPQAPESEKQVAAFRGYYNVASPRVRQAVHNGDQQGVWNAVAQVTTDNNATSDTHAYSALETANEQKAKREEYLRFFEGKFDHIPNAVGVVAVCNGRIMGVEIFARPDLFRRQYNALVHGYAAEAAVSDNSAVPAGQSIKQAFHRVAKLADAQTAGTSEAGKFQLAGQWVHLYAK